MSVKTMKAPAAKPILKWAGGKTQMLGELMPRVPKTYGRYIEPFFGGGAFCLLCDWIARTVFSPTELSISTVTAVFGAPIVIWMMLHREKR